jgi:HNH endonuclease
MSRWKPELAETRFWSHVDKRGPDECWEWKASLGPKGYGQFNECTGHPVRAHRFSFELAYGPLGKENALHTCDNRKCVNPKHLFRGTQAVNLSDMRKKGRHFHKLGDGQVRLIRLYALNKWAHHKIAEHFCVSRPTITAILSGRIQSSVR